jgi:hypothetical protein
MVNVDGSSLKLKAAPRFWDIGKQMCMFRVMEIKQSVKFAEIITAFRNCFAIPYIWDSINTQTKNLSYFIVRKKESTRWPNRVSRRIIFRPKREREREK